MNPWKAVPCVLRNKILVTFFVGIGCVSFSLVSYVIFTDHILLCLSSVIFAGCLLRCKSLYNIVSRGAYEVVTGTCIRITTTPMQIYRRITLMDETETEFSLLLNKQVRIKIGAEYRFYFQAGIQPTFGNDYLDVRLSSASFLGYEYLGDFHTGATAKYD